MADQRNNTKQTLQSSFSDPSFSAERHNINFFFYPKHTLVTQQFYVYNGTMIFLLSKDHHDP